MKNLDKHATRQAARFHVVVFPTFPVRSFNEMFLFSAGLIWPRCSIPSWQMMFAVSKCMSVQISAAETDGITVSAYHFHGCTLSPNTISFLRSDP